MCWPGGRVSTILLRALASSVVYIIPTRNETSLQLTRSYRATQRKSSQRREERKIRRITLSRTPPSAPPRRDEKGKLFNSWRSDLLNIARIRTNDVARWPVPYGATVPQLTASVVRQRRGLRGGSASHLCRPLSERIHGDLIPSQLRRRHFGSVGKI